MSLFSDKGFYGGCLPLAVTKQAMKTSALVQHFIHYLDCGSGGN
ncbi:MAG: hypothetical protein ACKV19_08605 [Verrucomicrobiales bacterium]